MLSLEEKAPTPWSVFPDLPLQPGSFSVYLPQPQQHQLRQAIKWWVTVLISPSTWFWLDYIEQQTRFTTSALGGCSPQHLVQFPSTGPVRIQIRRPCAHHTHTSSSDKGCVCFPGPSVPQLHGRDATHFFLRRMTTEKALMGRKGGWRHAPGNVRMTDTGHPKLALCDNLGGEGVGGQWEGARDGGDTCMPMAGSC